MIGKGRLGKMRSYELLLKKKRKVNSKWNTINKQWQVKWWSKGEWKTMKMKSRETCLLSRWIFMNKKLRICELKKKKRDKSTTSGMTRIKNSKWNFEVKGESVAIK